MFSYSFCAHTMLTQWDLVMCISIGEMGHHYSGNDLLPLLCQSITWTSNDWSSFEPSGVQFYEIQSFLIFFIRFHRNFNTGTGNSLVTDGTKPIPEPMLQFPPTGLGLCGIQLRSISQQVLKTSIAEVTSKVTLLKLQPHFPMANKVVCHVVNKDWSIFLLSRIIDNSIKSLVSAIDIPSGPTRVYVCQLTNCPWGMWIVNSKSQKSKCFFQAWIRKMHIKLWVDAFWEICWCWLNQHWFRSWNMPLLSSNYGLLKSEHNGRHFADDIL